MNEWIEASVQKPSYLEGLLYSVDIIFCTRRYEVCCGYYCDGKWFGYATEDIVSDVIAWMPLPNPPEIV